MSKESIFVTGPSGPRRTSHKALLGAVGALALLTITLQGSALLRAKPEFRLKEFDQKVFDDGMAQCQSFDSKPDRVVSTSRSNPRFVPGTLPTLIRNATLIDGDGSVFHGRNIYLEDGVVRSTDYHHAVPDNDAKYLVVEAGGRFVSPGLVDLHSHAGVDSLPHLWGNDDTNEISSPITSQVRVIDALNPSDEMLMRIMSGGVTSSLILPGSANLMGGEAYVIKHRPVKSLLVEDMLVQANITTKKERWIKMACGENPKRVYKTRTNSRLGEAWGFRHRFDEARTLMKKQDHWCARAVAGARYVPGEEFPTDLELETVVGVLRGDLRVNNHCYTTTDLEMMVRNTHEFDFHVTAFHHALEAYRVPGLMRDNNITVATFANLWGYKTEAFLGSVHAGKILVDAGVPLVYKSDHPVTNSQNLIYQAQIGYHFEVPAELAFASVSGVPATTMGLGHRIGFLRPGYDADVLLWSDHPLSLGAHPLQVWVDGAVQMPLTQKQLNEMPPLQSLQAKEANKPIVPDSEQCLEGSATLIINGIRRSFWHDKMAVQAEALSMIVKDGEITCLGSTQECREFSISAVQKGAKIMTLKNGHLIPGITTLAPGLGLVEIDAEKSTADGNVDSSKPEDANSVISAYDGLFFGGPHMERAHARGVLEVIVAPSGDYLKGISTAFKTSGRNILEDGAVIKKAVAVHFSIGTGDKGGAVPTVSSQTALLRKILKDNSDKDNIYGSVANGTIPLVIETDSSDTISHLVLLKQQYPDVRMIIKGGSEAYLVASELASLKIPVLLDHHRCMPDTWRSRRCLPGPPLTASTNLQLLHEAGVEVALISNDDGNLGEEYWEAAWATKLAGNYTHHEAVALVTTNVREILGLPRSEDAFVVMEGSPLELGSSIAMTFDLGRVAKCYPVLP